MKRTDPFASQYRACNTGPAAEKLASLADGPRIVDVELTTYCNLRCKMCPTGLHALQRPNGFMSRSTFMNILNDTDATFTAIRFIGWGEPVLHPLIHEFVAEATKAGRLTHVNSNGTHFAIQWSPVDYGQRLMRAGLSSLKVSFQGVDSKSYRAMRGDDKFDRLILVLKHLYDVRDALGADTFLSVSTTTTTESRLRTLAFVELVEPYVDRVSVGKTVFDFIDRESLSKSRQKWYDMARKGTEDAVGKHPNPCPEVYDKLTVSWNGKVRVCCNDYSGVTDLGDVNVEGIQAAWNHPTIKEYRQRLAEGRYEGPLCSVCYDYMGLTG